MQLSNLWLRKNFFQGLAGIHFFLVENVAYSTAHYYYYLYEL